MPATQIVGGPPSPGAVGAPGTPVVVDATFNAAHVALKPDEYQGGGTIGGHFRVGAVSGALTGVGAAGLVYSFKTPQTPSLWFVIKRITVAAVITTVFTGAQAVDFDLIKSTSFTAADTSGTAVTMAAGGKLRTAMTNSQVADIRISSTAALAAGTKTLDANAMADCVISQTNVVGSGGQVDIYKQDATGEHPLVLGANEGFNLRAVTAMGAAGVIKLYVSVAWAEAPGY